jgi:hypothetical protein
MRHDYSSYKRLIAAPARNEEHTVAVQQVGKVNDISQELLRTSENSMKEKPGYGKYHEF